MLELLCSLGALPCGVPLEVPRGAVILGKRELDVVGGAVDHQERVRLALLAELLKTLRRFPSPYSAASINNSTSSRLTYAIPH